MTTIEKSRRPWNLVRSVERGLDRMLTSPTNRVRAMRLELEREEMARRQRFEVASRESRQTLKMAATYIRSLPNS